MSKPKPSKAIWDLNDVDSLEASIFEILDGAGRTGDVQNLQKKDDNPGETIERNFCLVIVGGAFLDDLMHHALRTWMKRISNEKLRNDVRDDLMERLGTPLYFAKAKIDILLAIGLIGENTYSDLDNINTIRNKFAHLMDDGSKRITIPSFSRIDINDRCENLLLPKILTDTYLPTNPSDPRDRFRFSVIEIAKALWEYATERKTSVPILP